MPHSRKLWVTEPPVVVVEEPPVKCVLEYDVDIRFLVQLCPDGSTVGLPPPLEDGDDQGASAR